MKPSALNIPSRDMGLQPGLSALAQRLETVERRLAAVDGHPAERAVNVMGSADTVTLERQRVRDRVTDELYFKLSLAAGAMSIFTGPVTTPANGDANVMRFGPGALGAIERQHPGRSLWVGTRARISILYTSPVGNVANFAFRFLIRSFGAGSITTATPLVVNWTAPGPAVANTYLETTALITAGRVWSSPLFALETRLVRVAPDANPNDLDILLAVVTLEEVA